MWHDTTKEEVQAFVDILILMGIACFPLFEQYWSSNVYTHIEGITSIFGSKINAFCKFHHANNEALPKHGMPGYDKIGKVKNCQNILARNCETEYRLDRGVSIDETMVAHKGRLFLKQYMKAKPSL